MKKMTLTTALCAGLLICGQMYAYTHTVNNTTGRQLGMRLNYTDGTSSDVIAINEGLAITPSSNKCIQTVDIWDYMNPAVKHLGVVAPAQPGGECLKYDIAINPIWLNSVSPVPNQLAGFDVVITPAPLLLGTEGKNPGQGWSSNWEWSNEEENEAPGQSDWAKQNYGQNDRK